MWQNLKSYSMQGYKTVHKENLERDELELDIHFREGFNLKVYFKKVWKVQIRLFVIQC